MSDNKNVNNKEKGFVVGGYTFKTKQEAQEAKDEMNAIKYLSGKTDSKDPKQVYVLYNKIIDRQLFYTSISRIYSSFCIIHQIFQMIRLSRFR